jgi:hypothetical protein
LKPEIERLGLRVKVADTMMHTDSDKRRVAEAAIEFMDEIAADGRHS